MVCRQVDIERHARRCNQFTGSRVDESVEQEERQGASGLLISKEAAVLSEDALLFRTEAEAYRYIENHVWPEGPICPHCGTSGRASRMRGKSTRIGTYKCYACRRPFTVKIGTVFQSSHLPLHIWLRAIFLLSSTKCDVTADQLQRILEISPKTAAFLARRLGAQKTSRPAPPEIRASN